MIGFFFNDTATTEIYTLSLHDALPILHMDLGFDREHVVSVRIDPRLAGYKERQLPGLYDQLVDRVKALPEVQSRSEEHTSELQSQSNLVCRLLLEKKTIRIQARFRSHI